jgi:D-3-phosphoglycerate dehydrogenase
LATDVFPVNCPPYVDQLLPPERLDEVLGQSDIVVLCVPLNSTTMGMFNTKTFAQMKRGSILINVARGKVVVEEDLIKALESNHLRGAGLDVTEEEPLPGNSPLWQMPQVIITPHVGAQSRTRYDDVTDFFCQNLHLLQNGQPLRNLVDKQLGFPRREALATG